MSQIDTILSLTEQVEELIADGQWAQASALEAERRELLVDYVASAGKGAPGLRELYERSVHSLNTVSRTKRALVGEASRIISGSRAVDAYLENAVKASPRSGT